jgi:hypothetical protein
MDEKVDGKLSYKGRHGGLLLQEGVAYMLKLVGNNADGN